MGKKKSLRPYTVVGIYPDVTGFPHPRDGTWVTCSEAKDPQEAAELAVKTMIANTEYEPDDMAVLAVFEGEHDDVWEGP